jgi:hypothetical protein
MKKNYVVSTTADMRAHLPYDPDMVPLAAVGCCPATAARPRAYLDSSRALGDKVAEGAACCAYAACQQALGDLGGAVASLEEYLELSHGQVGVIITHNYGLTHDHHYDYDS